METVYPGWTVLGIEQHLSSTVGFSPVRVNKKRTKAVDVKNEFYVTI